MIRTAFSLSLALTLAAPAAHAEGGPAAQPTAPEEAYLASLQEELSRAREEEERASIAACNAAYDLLLGGTRTHEKARAELGALSPNPLLEEAQRPYRAALEAAIKVAQDQIAKAKADAKSAGEKRAAAEAKVSALKAEISRLKGAAALYAAMKAGTTAGLGAGSYRPRDPSPESLGTSIDVPQPKELPPEFKKCTPLKVAL